MKKTKSRFLIIILLIILGLTSFSFATMPEQNIENNKLEQSSTTIVSVSAEKVEKGKEFYLILNLSNISFNKFKVDITNTSSLSADEITTQVANLSTNSVATTFVVDKASMNLEKLGIVYTAPNDTCKISFELRITSLDETEEELKEKQITIQTELTTLNSNLNSLNDVLKGLEADFEKAKIDGLEQGTDIYNKFETQIAESNASIDKIETDIQAKNKENEELTNKITNFTAETIVEKIKVEVAEQLSEEEKENKLDKEDMLKMEEKNKEMTKDMEEMKSKMGDLESNLKDANDTISSLTKTTTYQGSQNNYLKTLSIEGIEFKNSFKKTTTNYFATVDKDVSQVSVNAIAEDSSAIVTIYGNTDLEEGQNKILITVTADDGSVKTYKIYLTK